MNASIAIIGAGMAGLSCASALAAAGRKPVLFDKGRGPGGRMATRRAEVNGQTLTFDHGAQYFTARDKDFIAQCERWKEAGVVAKWPTAGDDALVGTPGMNAPIRHMAEQHEVIWGARIERLEKLDRGWRLHLPDGEQDFDHVIVAIPAEQVAELLADTAPEYAEIAENSHSSPCWAVMLAFSAPLPIDRDTLRKTGAIGWAARNSAKPGREGTECWVVHGSAEWSREHLEKPAGDVAPLLTRQFFETAGIEQVEPIHATAHRWRYALAEAQDGPRSRSDPMLQLGLCGDWLVAPRVEGAWLSGHDLAQRILDNV